MTFSFTVDAVRGRVRGTTKDVLAAIQIVYPTAESAVEGRPQTEYVEKN